MWRAWITRHFSCSPHTSAHWNVDSHICEVQVCGKQNACSRHRDRLTHSYIECVRVRRTRTGRKKSRTKPNTGRECMLASSSWHKWMEMALLRCIRITSVECVFLRIVVVALHAFRCACRALIKESPNPIQFIFPPSATSRSSSPGFFFRWVCFCFFNGMKPIFRSHTLRYSCVCVCVFVLPFSSRTHTNAPINLSSRTEQYTRIT